jgi:hypothetical protein
MIVNLWVDPFQHKLEKKGERKRELAAAETTVFVLFSSFSIPEELFKIEDGYHGMMYI